MAQGRKTGGRQKGSLNKDSADIRAMIIGALNQVGGIDYLAARALDTPTAFMALVGKVLPTQLTGDPDNPVSYIVRMPSPVESTSEWLRLHAPQTIDADETIVDADETIADTGGTEDRC